MTPLPKPMTLVVALVLAGCGQPADSDPCPYGGELNALGFCVIAGDGTQSGGGGGRPPGTIPEGTEPTDFTDTTDCESHYAQLCYDGDVYWYDSCGEREERDENCAADEICLQVSPVDATCLATEDPCTPNDHKVCVGDDVYWADSCGAVGSLESSCDQTCLEGSGTATCMDLEYRCQDTDYDCYAASEFLSLDIECEVRTLGDEQITLTRLEIWARYASDDGDIDEWDRDTWTGNLSLSPGVWTDVPVTFDADLIDQLFDEELEIAGSLTAALGSDSAVLPDLDAESSQTVDVYDSWFCW